MCPDKAGKQLGQRTSLQFRVLSSGGSVRKSSSPNLKKEQKFPHRKHDDKIELHLLWLINLTRAKCLSLPPPPIICFCLFAWPKHGGFPSGMVVKNPPANARDVGSISGSGRSSGVGNGNPVQYSCLENSMDRGTCQATVQGVAKNRTRLSTRAHTRTHTHTHTHTHGLSTFFWSWKAN